MLLVGAGGVPPLTHCGRAALRTCPLPPLPRSHQIVVSHAVGTIPEMGLNRHDVWGHFAPMFHLVDVFAGGWDLLVLAPEDRKPGGLRMLATGCLQGLR